MNLLFPKIAKNHLVPMLRSAGIGFLIAAFYGAIHDLITYSIGPEYFTKLKFDQFEWMDFGQNSWVFAAMVGSIASGVVGLFAAWFFARLALPRHARNEALRRIRRGIVVTFAFAATGAIVGCVYGLVRGPSADYTFWDPTVAPLGVLETYPFVRVAYIHNGSYLGAIIGMGIGFFHCSRRTDY